MAVAPKPGGMVGSPSSLPIPDPTRLTSKAIKQALKDERHRADAVQTGERFRHDADVQKLNGELNVLIQRLDDADKAVKLLSAVVNQVPSETDLKTGQLKELFKTEVSGIYAVIGEQQKRAEGDANAAATAVAAALTTQKESQAKQEEATAKAIEKAEGNLQTLVAKNADVSAAETAAFRESISDLKEAQGDIRSQLSATVSDLRASLSAEINNVRTLVTNAGAGHAGGNATMKDMVAIGALLVAIIAVVYAIVKP